LRDINLRIGPRDRVALLCPAKGGLTELVGVISGAKAPEQGKVIRNSSLSWPIPGSAFLHKHLSFVGNARFIARLYGVDQSSFISRVIDMARVSDLAEERLSRCPKAPLSRFSFALGACLPFDIYFLTSFSIGDKKDKPRYAEVIGELASGSGLLIATGNPKGIQQFCDQAYVFEQSGPVHYDDVEVAIEHFSRIAKPAEMVEDGDGSEDVDEDRGFGDF
jgi:capsular polysaccharide transport system ATP-binding protein